MGPETMNVPARASSNLLDWKINIKEMGQDSTVASTGSGNYGDEPSGSIKRGRFRDHPNNY
jgi:hypothetical protein